jgi:DNA-binding SARP family transcriptional activator
MAEGAFARAIDVLSEAGRNRNVLGSLHALINARIIESLFLSTANPSLIAAAERELQAHPADPRYAAETVPARALSIHVAGKCRGRCLSLLSELENAYESGAIATAITGMVKVGVLAIEHGRARELRRAWNALSEAASLDLLFDLRWWLRRYAPRSTDMVDLPDGLSLMARLTAEDPDGWRGHVVDSIRPLPPGGVRSAMLDIVARHANRDVVDAMRSIEGKDVLNVRRHLQLVQAARLYLRTFGGVSLHRGNWDGPPLKIERKRVRMLLAVLAAHRQSTLTRDMALDILWPEADADSAVNNLNQAVYQLRRYIDPDYRGGDSPEYVISNSDQVALNPELVHTDLEELRRLPQRLAVSDWHHRQAGAKRAIDLIRGEFLADLRYEDWAARQQVSIHNEVRERLLAIALSPVTGYDVEVSSQAAAAILLLDPFDETATLALAECLARSGRKVAARKLVIDFARRLQEEMDMDPSPLVTQAAEGLEAGAPIKHLLTQSRGSLTEGLTNG